MPDPTPPPKASTPATPDTEAIAEAPGEVRAALAEATPGPWPEDWIYDAVRHIRRNCDFIGTYSSDPEFSWSETQDAHLIANAPTWLAQLLAALEAERVAHAETRRYDEEVLNLAHDRAIAAEAALTQALAERDGLRAALREIAYSPKTLPMGIRPLARAALATAPNTKDGEG